MHDEDDLEDDAAVAIISDGEELESNPMDFFPLASRDVTLAHTVSKIANTFQYGEHSSINLGTKSSH